MTIVWCCFFIINGGIAAYTTFFCSREVWALYNGGISYALMGTLFVVEYIIRKLVDGKMIKAYPISKFKADSRKDDYIMCYDDVWSKKSYKTWKDFLIDTAKMRKFIESNAADEYIVHVEDYWYFLCTFVALLQCKKAAYLTQNITESFLADVRKPEMAFFTDQNAPNSLSIADIIEKSEVPAEE